MGVRIYSKSKRSCLDHHEGEEDMTAEVAVMNKLGVALAADSAVTFAGPSHKKIYNAANKLFSLSKHEPVGIMIYGNAELMGVPWEPIIKIYRDQLGAGSFRRLSDYFDDFVSFLEHSDVFFDSETQERFVRRNAASYYFAIRKTLMEKVEEVIEAQGHVSRDDVAALIDGLINDRSSVLESRDFSTGLDEGHQAELTKRYAAILKDAIEHVFQKFPLTEVQIGRLTSLGTALFCRAILPESRSGLVIAGFGTEEHYPSVRACELDCRAADRLHFLTAQPTEITTEMAAAIIPFAQSDVVNLFIEGIDSGYEQVLDGYLDEIFDQYPDILASAVPSLKKNQRMSIADRWKQAGGAMLDKLRDKRAKYVNDKYVQPMMNIVGGLPMSELAGLAEALVNLTSLKRRVSMDLETVGGPVDVAVISKGDGMVWIKRKHYFDPSLNHQFFANYFRRHSNAGATNVS
jgi:hypothetical protein